MIGEVVILWQDAMCIGYELYSWWKRMWFGEERFRNNGEMVVCSEKEPAALVLVYEHGIECDLEYVGGSCVCLKQWLGGQRGGVEVHGL